MSARSGVRRVSAVALAVCLAFAAHMARADMIYKCVDASARVTYQSEACSNGSALDLAPGAFDPQAAQRLREDAAAWNLRDDLRRARAAGTERAPVVDADSLAPAPAAPACLYCDGWNGVVAWPYPRTRPRPPRPHRPPPPKQPSTIVV
ncbi:MAG: hypothetical protein ABI294_08295, partial [Casimicrobiaceae bacterium]